MDIHGETFLEEARELLASLENALIELERTPDEMELVGQVFRALHTIKGSGAMFGFDRIATFTHEIETLFDLVRRGELPVTHDLINLTLAARDQIQRMVDAARGGPAPTDDELRQLTVAFQALSPHAPEEDAAVLPVSEEPGDGLRKTYRIRFRPGGDIFRRGVNPVGLLRELAAMGACRIVAQTDAIPPLEELDPETSYLYWDLILTTHEPLDAIRDVFIFVEDDSEVDIHVIDEEGWLDDSGEYKRLGEILVERGDITADELQLALQSKKRLGDSLLEAGLVDGGKLDSALAEQEQIQALRRERQRSEFTSTIRVRSGKLDALVNLVGELVTVQARLSRTAGQREDPELQSIAEEVERLTWDLRDQILNIRMVPIGTTFSSYNRLVRDLCDELGKNVELLTRGAETELDKTVIERLNDPLVHLIRNCVDHGIEPPAERKAAGKPVKGTITLSAQHAGANVIIQVRDDGRGLDLAAIRTKALALGLIAPEAELREKDLTDLIMSPGFSTATRITNVSGRGVGMDVVKKAIEDLRGTIEVRGHRGEGVTFTIKLPLTLAIIDGLLVRIQDDFYIFPLGAVEECIELRQSEIRTGQERHLVNVRGELVPYISLREQFLIAGEVPAIQQVVIAEIDDQRIGFVVDHVIGEHQTVIKNLGRFYRDIRGLAGATILGDGTVALILDLLALVKIAQGREELALAGGARPVQRLAAKGSTAP